MDTHQIAGISRRTFLYGLAAAVTAATGCSATGGRDDLPNASSLREQLSRDAFNDSLDSIATRMTYFLQTQQDNTQASKQAQEFKTLLQSHQPSNSAPLNIGETSPALDTLLYQNQKIHNFFSNNRANYWVIDSINRNVD